MTVSFNKFLTYLGVLVSLSLLFLSNSKIVKADFAPGPPECSTGYDSYTNSEAPRTCGYLDRNFHINIGNFQDKIVILRYTTQLQTVDPDEIYSVAEDDVIQEDRTGISYLAVDKNYFDNNGGIQGIFSTSNLKGSQGNYTVMSPKDKKGFDDHTYDFIVSKDDHAIRLTYGSGNPELIDSTYIRFEPFDEHVPASDLRCGDSIKCKSDVTYVPQSIQNKHVVLVKSKEVYSPSSVVELTLPSPTPHSSVNSPIPESIPNLTVTPQPTNHEYTSKFLLALAVTLLLELPILLFLFNKINKKPKIILKNSIYASFIANGLTLPYVWFVFPFILSYPMSLILSEIFAVLIEAIFYTIFLKVSFKKTLLISLIANLISFSVGWLFNLVSI